MGKPKRGAKTHEEDVNDDDDEVNEATTDKKDMDEPSKAAKKTRKPKKGKAREDEDEWEIERELKAISLESNLTDEADDVPAPTVKKKVSAGKAKAMSGFQLLGELEDDHSDDNSQTVSMQEESTENVMVMDRNKPKKKDKNKKKEKEKKPEEEDIDAIMASLELSEKTGDKKKGKKGKKVEVEEDVSSSLQEVVEVEKVEHNVVTADDLDVDDERKKKKKKGKKGHEETTQSKAAEEKQEHDDDDEAAEGDDGEGGTVKSAAQKRKEKREREKQKKIQEKQKQKKGTKKEQAEDGEKKEELSTDLKREDGDSVRAADDGGREDGQPVDGGEGPEGKKEDKKKKKKGEKEEKAKPNKKIAALKEHLKKLQEEEMKAKEEEERLRLEEEERIRQYEEQKRLEEERKQKKKLKKKEHIERLKKEGKFLTEKQKQDKRRLEQMLETRKEAGADVPNKEEVTRKRPVYTKKKRVTGQTDTLQEKSPSPTSLTSPIETTAPDLEPAPVADGEKDEDGDVVAELEKTTDDGTTVEEKEEVKEVWDAESEEEEDDDYDEEEENEDKKDDTKPRSTIQPVQKLEAKKEEEEEEEESSDEDDHDDESGDEEEEDSSEESESDDNLTPAERGRDKVLKRADQANKDKSVDKLRAPVVCVLGHVDTGKTKILDKLRRTNVQDGEAGGITQQIGATNVPKDAILDKTKMCKEFTKQELKLPGLLIIDTPGHESFSNLRVRGTSLCDIAILVVDIMHGLEPQTIESINLLKERKTPFLVALNKIDRLYQWKPQPMADVQNTVKKQTPHTKSEFDERAQQVILGLAQEGLNAALFYENKNPKEYISLVPTSAHTGDGMGNLVSLICDLCQNLLTKRLMYSSSLQAVVMEVKAITGMGTTIDVILINGALNEGDTVVLAGTEGPIVTQIRGLLMPQPMKELRVKNQYEHHKTVMAAQGVKIIAKDMEKALAGLPLYVAHDADEKEYFKDEVSAVLKDTLESIKVQERGVFVQASTLGSLEALLEFLRTSQIPFAGISIGPVHKKDIMKASVMLEHDSQYAVILAFDVKVERDAQELADNLGVRIFTADIIYHLFDAFTKYREDLKKKRQEEFRHIAVFPCKLRILPQFIFNSRDPIVMGVSIEAGFVKEGTPICVPSKEFIDLGRVASIEANHKTVDIARQGQEICIKIMPIPGEAPKMYGRHFDETDMLVSKISRQSIDAVKDHFREEMNKQDWKLMVDLKKQFEIL